MSLEGLDAPAVQEAYQQASVEASGWSVNVMRCARGAEMLSSETQVLA